MFVSLNLENFSFEIRNVFFSILSFVVVFIRRLPFNAECIVKCVFGRRRHLMSVVNMKFLNMWLSELRGMKHVEFEFEFEFVIQTETSAVKCQMKMYSFKLLLSNRFSCFSCGRHSLRFCIVAPVFMHIHLRANRNSLKWIKKKSEMRMDIGTVEWCEYYNVDPGHKSYFQLYFHKS